MLEKMVALQVGDIVKGKVSRVETNEALIDLGYKFDGVLPLAELSNVPVAQVSDVLNVGDEVEVQVLRLEEDKLTLSKKAIDAVRAWKEVQHKFETGETVTATVVDVVKGGLVVNVGVRGFIPASMVERHFVEDFSGYKGRQLELKVVEFDVEKNKLILSRKAVLQAEEDRQKEATLKKLAVGQVLQGTVRRLTNFGAFIDLGGVDGLAHVSELSWNRVENPAEILAEGDVVTVKVLKIDRDGGRISLSLKETQTGPWDQVKLEVGGIVNGQVKRLVPFGAFVEVAPGVEGLIHVSQIANRHIHAPSEALELGQTVTAKVLEFNSAQKRISLSIREVEREAERKEREQFDLQNQEGLGVTLGDKFPQLRNFKE